MKRLTTGVLTGTVVAAIAAALAQPAATAAMRSDAPSQAEGPAAVANHRPDNRRGPLTKRQDALRMAAVEKLA